MYWHSYLRFYVFFGQFCGVFMTQQNVQIAMKIMNIFEKFFNRVKEWHLMMLNPVVKPFWTKSYIFSMLVNILHCEKWRSFILIMLSKRIIFLDITIESSFTIITSIVQQSSDNINENGSRLVTMISITTVSINAITVAIKHNQ